jgi:hypothetical protein
MVMPSDFEKLLEAAYEIVKLSETLGIAPHKTREFLIEKYKEVKELYEKGDYQSQLKAMRIADLAVQYLDKDVFGLATYLVKTVGEFYQKPQYKSMLKKMAQYVGKLYYHAKKFDIESVVENMREIRKIIEEEELPKDVVKKIREGIEIEEKYEEIASNLVVVQSIFGLILGASLVTILGITSFTPQGYYLFSSPAISITSFIFSFLILILFVYFLLKRK